MALNNQSKPLSDKDQLIWLQLGMAYFHNTQISLKTLATITIKHGGDEMNILTYKKQDYWIPKYIA